MKNNNGEGLVTVVISIITMIILATMCIYAFGGEPKAGKSNDIQKTLTIAQNLEQSQPTPTDVDYSLERYNLIRRAYWVNGQREKANTLICEIEKPLGYVVLFTDNGSCVGSFVVDGKITSLNSFLTPDSEYYEIIGEYRNYNKWLADVDGSYGNNDSGIFFFTSDGKYIEWTGTYLYSDIPFEVKNPVVTYKEVK